MRSILFLLLCLLPNLVFGLYWYNYNGDAMEFDGSQNQYVNLPDEYLVPSSGVFTLSVWVRTDEDADQVFEVLAQQNSWSMYFWNPFGAHFYLGRGSSGNVRVGDDWQDTGVPWPDDNKWHNFTVVKGASETYLYIDGKFASLKGGTIRNPLMNTSWIGKQYSFSWWAVYEEYFSGQIDELKVWNVELTKEQIRQKMHATLPCNEPDLYTYIQFNSQSATVLEGHRGSSDTIQGSICNGATFVNGNSPTGLTTVDHIIIQSNGSYTFDNGVSLHIPTEFGLHDVYVHKTLKPDSILDYTDDFVYYLYDYRDGGVASWSVDQISFQTNVQLGEYFAVFPEKLNLYFVPDTYDSFWQNWDTASEYDVSTRTSTFSFDVDQYWDPSYNTRNRLVYGIVPQEKSDISVIEPSDEDVTGLTPELSVTIAHDYSGGSTCQISAVSGNAYLYRQGALVETIPLDDSMVSGATITFTPANPLEEGGYYSMKLDHGALTDDQNMPVMGIDDETTWNFTATGSVSLAGNCIHFYGDNDYIVVNNESLFDFTSGNLTIEAWIKADGLNNMYNGIVTKGDTSWRLQRYSTSNTLQFAAGNGSTNNIIGTVNINDNQWHHIAAVKDGTQLRLYVDGVLDVAGTCAGTIPVNDFPVIIGANCEILDRSWNGFIDDVRIWQSARTLEEIRLNMHHPITETNADLVSYWKFDEESGNTCYDWTGHASGSVEDCSHVITSAPIADGASEILTINETGEYPMLDDVVHVNESDLPTTIMLSRLDSAPNILPVIESTLSSCYWIFQNFDSATSTISLELTPNQEVGMDDSSYFKLCNRASNSIYEWEYACNATSLSTEMEFLFESITETGQFVIGKDTTIPTLLAMAPANDTYGTSVRTEMTLTFDKEVVAGSGFIRIYDMSDNLISEIQASDATIDDETATFAPATSLELNTEYYALVDPDAFTFFGNAFPGINVCGEWSFTTMDVSIESGTCVQFDGISQNIMFEDGLIPPSGDFSLSLWALADEDQTGFREIVSQMAGDGTKFYLGVSNDGNVRCGDGWNNTGVEFPLDSGWHYYTIVKSTDDTKVYIDGFLKASRGSAIGNPQGGEFRVGKQCPPSNEFFDGKVDEIKIWDRALTTDEVRMYMHRIADVTDENLISYIQFNEEGEEYNDLISGEIATGDADRAESTIEVGNIDPSMITITETGLDAIGSTGVSLDVQSMTSDIHAYVTRFTTMPHHPVYGDNSFDAQFWAIHLFSDDDFDTDIIFQPAEPIDPYYETHMDLIDVNWRQVYRRYTYWNTGIPSNVNSTDNTVTYSNYVYNGLYKLSSNEYLHLTGITPPDGSVVQDSVVFELTFNMQIWPSDGSLSIYRYDDDTLFEEMEVASLNVSDDSFSIYVDPQNTLEPGITYYVLIESHSIWSWGEIPYDGISDKDVWNFTAEPGGIAIPANITIAFDGEDLVLSWDPVQYANSWLVMASDSPDGTFSDVSSDGAISTEYSPGRVSWICPQPSATRRFYRIIASTESAVRSTSTKARKEISR